MARHRHEDRHSGRSDMAVWSTNLSMDAKVLGDEFSVYVDMPEFEKLGKLHAQAMLDKKV